ncbi:MAG TPA: hypothetical protein VIJ15_12255 [Dermatophilaceae bacterium]
MFFDQRRDGLLVQVLAEFLVGSVALGVIRQRRLARPREALLLGLPPPVSRRCYPAVRRYPRCPNG